MWFSVHSLAVLWLLKQNLQFFRERVAHWNIIACTINSSSFFLYLEHHKQKEKANSTFLFFLVTLLIMLHIAYLRRNGKFNTNSTRHLIITIFFTPIPGSYIWGPIYIFQIEKSQGRSGGGRAAQTGTTSYAQTIRSAFKSSHSFRENKACWENIL